MSVLIKKAVIIDSESMFHLQKVDVLVERGVITAIGKNITTEVKNVIEQNDVYISPGWMDMHAEFNDPGFEHKEDLASGADAAKNGGFTTVLISANNHPITETKAHINYISFKNSQLPVDVIPIAALTEGAKGKNFTEFYDLQLAGAVAFSDGHYAIQNPDLLKRALQYAKTINGKIIVYANDQNISNRGMMHEGPMSTSLGLKSEPALSEEIRVARDLAIAEYCNAPIHFMTISTAGAVAQIKNAKKRGLHVTCDVAIANLVWNDTALVDFDSNYKVTPPLRLEKDRKALIKGVNDGTIDAIVTNHKPQNIEEKQCEFDHAAFGQSSIETAFGLYQTYLSSKISLETWVNAVCVYPRKMFNQTYSPIAIGAKANLTIFSTTEKWRVTAATLKSKSKNTPVIGEELTGKVVSVIC